MTLKRHFYESTPGVFVLAALIFVMGSALDVLAGLGAHAQSATGPVSDEGAPDRMQAWRVPSADPAAPSHAMLYRPPGEGPFPLAIIAHGSTQNALQRAQMGMPGFRGLAHALVARGFAVLVPQRPGHGETGGNYVEGQGRGCSNADYARAGRGTATSIANAIAFMKTQSFIKPGGAWVVGQSAGGWGALAFAATHPTGISQIVVFAAGRGGHADNTPNKNCAPEKLIDTARQFGREAGGALPVTWIIAENDSYFAPDLSHSLAKAFAEGGAKVNFRVEPAYRNEGHHLSSAKSEMLAPLLPR